MICNCNMLVVLNSYCLYDYNQTYIGEYEYIQVIITTCMCMTVHCFNYVKATDKHHTELCTLIRIYKFIVDRLLSDCYWSLKCSHCLIPVTV